MTQTRLWKGFFPTPTMNEETNCLIILLIQLRTLSLALDEAAIECCVQDWRIVVSKVLMNEERLGLRGLARIQSDQLVRIPISISFKVDRHRR
jgi:hypothetical protein